MENKINEKYSDQFYKGIISGCQRAAHRIVPFLLLLFPHIRTVADIGCGTGAFLREFLNHGKIVQGYDFGSGVGDNLLIDPTMFELTDLSTPLKVKENYFDLCISLEVAEHLEACYADQFVSNITSVSDVVLFSAARPKQGGTHHVNCQWPEYWAAKFGIFGYIVYDILRPVFWDDETIPWWYRQNWMLFISQKTASRFPALEEYVNLNCMKLIHPESIKI